MTYQQRLNEYERRKKTLKGLTYIEYQRRVKKILKELKL